MAVVLVLGTLVGVVTISAPATAAPITAFSARFHTNDNGAITTIGNDLMTCPAAAANCLAARLAYFLWNSPPDATLRAAAARGDLSDPARLRVQTERMLADSRAKEKLQWLVREFPLNNLYREELAKLN